MAPEPFGLVPGTLELLILKTLSLGELHGYGVLLRLQQLTGRAITIEQGALYPALFRLERQGLVETEWGTSDNNRRAKFYRLSTKGRRRLRQETHEWNRVVDIMAAALKARS
jgi:PadR family transcriptional regulator PadR